MAVKNTTQVLIDGKIITLGGYESPEYLQKVAAYLNQKISELSQSAGYNRLSVDTKHTLLALNIADDYFKAKSQVDTLEEDMEAKDRETYDMKHDLIAAEKSWKRNESSWNMCAARWKNCSGSLIRQIRIWKIY